jgi:hypothetical protein
MATRLRGQRTKLQLISPSTLLQIRETGFEPMTFSSCWVLQDAKGQAHVIHDSTMHSQFTLKTVQSAGTAFQSLLPTWFQKELKK